MIIGPPTSHALVALYRTAHTIIDVAELLPIVNIFVSVIDVNGAGYEVAVLAAVGKGGETGGQAIAQGPGSRGEGVDGEVLGVTGAVPAPGREQDVCAGEEEEEGDDGGDNERLEVLSAVSADLGRCGQVGRLTCSTLREEALPPMTDDGMMRLANFNGFEMTTTRPLARPGWSCSLAQDAVGTLSSWIRGIETCLLYVRRYPSRMDR